MFGAWHPYLQIVEGLYLLIPVIFQPWMICSIEASQDIFVFHKCGRRKTTVVWWVEVRENPKPSVLGSSMEQHTET